MTLRLRKLPAGLPTPSPAPARKRRGGTATPLEKEIQTEVIDYLRAIGATVIRVNSGMRVIEATANTKRRAVRCNSAPGCSDLLVCLPGGHFAGIEIKRPGNLPTTLQREFLARVQASGGLAIYVVSVDDLQAKLRAEGLI